MPSATETTILAVDDDRTVLDLVKSILGSAGYRVLVADGAWGAIEKYEAATQPIDLLLTDVIMPDLTGPVLAERLRSRQPDLKVLFMSGYHDTDVVRRFSHHRDFTLLPKPFTMQGLLTEVGKALG